MVAGDALDFDPRDAARRQPARIVANLPYNIATALLVGWLTVEPWPPWYDRLVLMFQREVAERSSPRPARSLRPAVRARRLAQRGAHPVRRRAIRLRAAAEGDLVAGGACPARGAAAVRSEALQRVTEAAFGQRRKMLRQSLKSLGRDPMPLLDASRASRRTARAEDIPVEGFVRLARAFDGDSAAAR